MTAATFDTLAYAKRLVAAGVPEQQAEAHAEALREFTTEQLATKADIELLRADFRREMADLRREMADLKADLLKWVIGLFIAQAGLFAVLVKLIH